MTVKITNPNAGRPLIAAIVDDETGKTNWHEIPAGESIEVEDYVVASTLVEHGATAVPAELQAARELWAEKNRAKNSKTASASASEGELVKRQATASVATGTVEGGDAELKGAALAEAVKLANENGAEIPASLSADEKREALRVFAAREGVTSSPEDEFVVVDGELVLDDEQQPIPLDSVVVDENGDVVFEDGKPVRKPVDA